MHMEWIERNFGAFRCRDFGSCQNFSETARSVKSAETSECKRSFVECVRFLASCYCIGRLMHANLKQARAGFAVVCDEGVLSIFVAGLRQLPCILIGIAIKTETELHWWYTAIHHMRSLSSQIFKMMLWDSFWGCGMCLCCIDMVWAFWSGLVGVIRCYFVAPWWARIGGSHHEILVYIGFGR